METFKIGDAVSYVGPDIRYAGLTGRIDHARMDGLYVVDYMSEGKQIHHPDCLVLVAIRSQGYQDTAIPIGEKDPNGVDQHSPGAKVDAGKCRMALVLDAFAHALWAVSEVGTFGAEKYTDDGWLSVPNGVARYEDAMLRHHFKEKMGETYDDDSGLLHKAHRAWNALATLELHLREKDVARTGTDVDTPQPLPYA